MFTSGLILRNLDYMEKQGMKERWETLMKQFQGMPLTITPSHVRKKSRLERELQQLEKDITFIEQHPHIYVYDDT